MSAPRVHLPDTLVGADGCTYRLVRQRAQLDDGREVFGRYELAPERDEFRQFTPEVGYLLGYLNVPRMLPVTR